MFVPTRLLCAAERKTQWRWGSMKWQPSLPFRERKFYLLHVNIQKPWFPPPCVISRNWFQGDTKLFSLLLGDVKLRDHTFPSIHIGQLSRCFPVVSSIGTDGFMCPRWVCSCQTEVGSTITFLWQVPVTSRCFFTVGFWGTLSFMLQIIEKLLYKCQVASLLGIMYLASSIGDRLDKN